MAFPSVNLGPRSVAFRVIAFSTVWAIITLVVIATVISALYYRSSVRSFRTLLSAHMFNLVSSVSVSDDGTLSGTPDLGDLRFNEPGSGWYWAVEPISPGLHGGIQSPSLTGKIPGPRRAVPFDADFRRHYRARGPSGERLEVLESEIVLDTNNRIARFLVTGNRNELRAEIDSFQHRVYLYLSLFGIGMILINAVAILLGLRPLDRVRQSLQRVREGSAQRLEGDFPAEIEPLAAETNALIDNSRRMIERSRLQVGNLAHSLKTPIAVLLNEGRAIGGRQGKLVIEQTAAMQQQVEHYLRRARIASQRDSVVFRTPLSEPLGRLVRVMTKLNPDIAIALHAPDGDVVFAGETEDFEEIAGNLLENAMKWAQREVSVSLSGSGSAGSASLSIEDDGPGIPAERADEALKRGMRLDETKPGSGLGLAIVSDLVEEYGGSLELGKSELGGLKIVVRLPAG
jgi:signal transduction histidine kinase